MAFSSANEEKNSFENGQVFASLIAQPGVKTIVRQSLVLKAVFFLLKAPLFSSSQLLLIRSWFFSFWTSDRPANLSELSMLKAFQCVFACMHNNKTQPVKLSQKLSIHNIDDRRKLYELSGISFPSSHTVAAGSSFITNFSNAKLHIRFVVYELNDSILHCEYSMHSPYRIG